MNYSSAHRFVPASDEMMPRFLEAGDVTLDLFHRDARIEDHWLYLHPREFELLWRLAQSPRQRLSRKRLLAEVWRLDKDPGTNSLAVHVARIRTKLDQFGLGRLIATHPDGGYFLDTPPEPSVFVFRGALSRTA